MVASVTMVTGSPALSTPIGVAWVSTRDRVPSPSVISMTMVRASGQENSARTGTPQVWLRRNATSTVSNSSLLALSSTVRWLNAYGWNQAPCQGSSRLAMTSRGSHVPRAYITADTDDS